MSKNVIPNLNAVTQAQLAGATFGCLDGTQQGWQIDGVNYNEDGTENTTATTFAAGAWPCVGATTPGATFADLVASDSFIYSLAGQSNAVGQNGGSVDASFSSWANANIQASATINKEAVSGTGFTCGEGEWTPIGAQGSSLITKINTLKAAQTSDTKWGPIVWIQGLADAGDLNDSGCYEQQVNYLYQQVRDQTGLNLPWVVVRINASSTPSRTAEVAAAQNAFAAANNNVYVVDVDDLPLVDGLHYSGTDYGVIEQRIRAIIDANKLILTPTEASYIPTVETGGGLVFDAVFNGTPGQSLAAFTPSVGSISDSTGSGFEIHSSGTGLISVATNNTNPGYLLSVDQIPVGEVVRIEASWFNANTNPSGPVFRTLDSPLLLLHLSANDSATNTASLFSYDSVYTNESTQSFSPPGDDIFSAEIEFSSSEVRWIVQGNPVQTFNTLLNPLSKNVGFRLTRSPSHRLYSLQVSGLTSFSI